MPGANGKSEPLDNESQFFFAGCYHQASHRGFNARLRLERRDDLGLGQVRLNTPLDQAVNALDLAKRCEQSTGPWPMIKP